MVGTKNQASFFVPPFHSLRKPFLDNRFLSSFFRSPSFTHFRMDPPPSFLSLPSELQHMIYRYVDLRDLAVYASVNKQWNIVITPFIWHSFDIVSQKQGILFRKAETQEALKRNTGHIRDLHINLKNMAVYRSIFMEK